MTSRHGLLLLGLALALFAAPSSARAQPLLIRQVIGSGATAGVSPTHALAGTIGQTIIGRSTSSSHIGALGFWYTYPVPTGPGAVREEYVRGVTGASSAMRVAPNPVVDVATITVSLPQSGDVRLGVFDGLGQERVRLIDGWREAGTTSVQVPARTLESGDYLLVLVTSGERSAVPMRVIK